MWKSIRKHFLLPSKLTNKLTKKEHPNEEFPDEQHCDEERSDEEWSSEGHSDEGHSDEELSDEESSVKRFRVLIVGPANAGKTTLLERLTESPAGAAIVTRNGQRVIA
jgi:polynucleotide 5'-kinase involved in rRNA processing